MSWVRVPPRAAPFSFEKELVLVGIALFVMHLPCTLDSCKLYVCLSSLCNSEHINTIMDVLTSHGCLLSTEANMESSVSVMSH